MKKMMMLMMMGFLIVGMTGCVPPFKKELLVEIKPNETAFVVPLEGKSKSGQGKFMSLEYLEANKVATKRISIPQRKQETGRGYWQIKYIPTAKVIRVNRQPVTREWTKDEDRGTNKTNEAIDVESKDSIGFSVGVNITALVMEEDASLFQYTYSGVPLFKLMDSDVRGFITSILSREFGVRNLKECKADKKSISDILLKETSEKFKQMGITISNVGLVGGLVYEDEKIQEAINEAYVAEMSVAKQEQANLKKDKINKQRLKDAEQEKLIQVKTNDKNIAIAVAEAEEKRLFQEKINQMNIAKAKADRIASEEFAKAEQANISRMTLEIKLIEAKAVLEKAERWDGKLPEKILPENSSFLFSD